MRTLALVFMFLFVLAALPAASAQEWVVIGHDVDHMGNWIRFVLDDSQLTLPNRSYWRQSGAHSYDMFSLLFSGTWAVCGTVTNAGVVCTDQYATFVATGTGEGHIRWAPNTPAGHTTKLLLGYRFSGDGATTYTGYCTNPYDRQERPPATGTLVLYGDCDGATSEFYYYDRHYSQQQHAFDLTYPVPEPAGLASLLMGLVGTGTLLARKRR